MVSSEGTWIDDGRRLARIDVTADTQADDGMRLRSFVPFSALTPAGLPPWGDMEKAVRAMAAELTAMRTAPVAANGSANVLFEGLAAGQIIKHLLAEQLVGAAAKTAPGGRRATVSRASWRKLASFASSLIPISDVPRKSFGPGNPMYGASCRRQGSPPAASRRSEDPRRCHAAHAAQEINSDGPRTAPSAAEFIGNPIVTPIVLAGAQAAGVMEKAAAGGLGVPSRAPSATGCRWAATPMTRCRSSAPAAAAAQRPAGASLVVYRVKDGKEQAGVGPTLEALVPIAREITAVGRVPAGLRLHRFGRRRRRIPPPRDRRGTAAAVSAVASKN